MPVLLSLPGNCDNFSLVHQLRGTLIPLIVKAQGPRVPERALYRTNYLCLVAFVALILRHSWTLMFSGCNKRISQEVWIDQQSISEGQPIALASGVMSNLRSTDDCTASRGCTVSYVSCISQPATVRPTFIKALIALISAICANRYGKSDENSEKCQKTHGGYESQL